MPLLSIQFQSIETFKRNKYKGQITQIFKNITAQDSELRNLFTRLHLNFEEFKPLLDEYKKALLEELDNLPGQYLLREYNHPLRAANALAKLNTITSCDCFNLDVSHFNQEANNFIYNPKQQNVIEAITLGLFIVACTFLVLSFFALPQAGIILTSIFAGLFTATDKLEMNTPEMDRMTYVQRSGDKISRFFTKPEFKSPFPSLAPPCPPYTVTERAEQVSTAAQTEAANADIAPPAYKAI